MIKMILTYLGNEKDLNKLSISELRDLSKTPNLNETSISQINVVIRAKLKELLESAKND